MELGGLRDYDELELELLKRGYIRLEAKITRMSPNIGRYLIYLPSSNNDLWRAIRESGARVIIYMKVPWGVVMARAQANRGGEAKDVGGPATS